MNIKALEIRIGELRAGVLFQYQQHDGQTVNRFIADKTLADNQQAPTISLSYVAENPEDQALLWQDHRSPLFNGQLSKDQQSCLLPAFFQNLLPEGVFRGQIAELRQCAPNDHFELLAACGKDLPGNIYALPAQLSHEDLGQYIAQTEDTLQLTVTLEPLEQGVSLSGVQPKLGVIKDGDRYVGRTKDRDTHIIAKLPVVAYPLLPEVEELSLRLAKAAGVNACDAYLEPMSKLAAQHHYDSGDLQTHPSNANFLAVVRYDRQPGTRIHCEDFAQVFGVMPEDKYSKETSYLSVAALMLSLPSLGEAAVHELLRRIMVNEMLGNPDMHLKNIGLWYPDGRTPELPPAYDIVAHTLYTPVTGHGLRILPATFETELGSKDTARPGKKMQLTPGVLRAFCNGLGIPERPAAKVLSNCVKAAYASWPAMIEASLLTLPQKQKLLAHFYRHHAIAGLVRRQKNQA
ncbi:MAG: type II toxin-antitoxin system HipA family toxin [Burkholderiaceae bacterium]|nr:type II toxin-antitoxin system HipA family toxin [Burkholderiaceae bacterium]